MSIDLDNTTPLAPSSHFVENRSMPVVQEVEAPELAVNLPHAHRGLFSAFRTHISVSFPLFAPVVTASTKPIALRRTSANKIDLEKQAHINNLAQPAITASSLVETKIWGGDVDDDLDPNAPKIGTRAYRERERREMIKRECRGKREIPRVLPDNVHVGMDLALQDSETEHGGVEVKHEFVQKEEGA